MTATAATAGTGTGTAPAGTAPAPPPGAGTVPASGTGTGSGTGPGSGSGAAKGPGSGRRSGPPEGTPARSRGREIEGWRGLAALSTVVFHVWQQYYRYDAQGAHAPLDNPYLAALISLEVIDLFFVTSAYLLTISYARAAIDGGSVRPASAFLFRRAVRIVPLYFLAVLVVWATRNPTLPGDWLDLVEHLTFTHVFDRDRIFYTLGPAWSLSLEVIFYLALVAIGPLAIRGCRALRTRRARVIACASGCLALFVIPVAWIALAHYGWHVPHTDWPVYFGPQARFGGFAAGMGLAVLKVALGDRGRVGPGVATALTVSAALGLYWLSYDSAPENATFMFYHPAASVLWAVMLYGTVHVARRVPAHGLLRSRALTWVGLVSYSLFIWHEPVLLQLYDSGLLPTDQSAYPLAALIVLAVSLPVAWASYWLVEYPSSLLGRLKDNAGRPRDFYPESPAEPPR
ncbi:acyltransferase family protein [Streptomyces phytohabitans]|uniref:acyltransferase family protein n=1 Tax=Streptomyces phytohabitans TaxID=1150371 RepID=UPI00345C472F